MSEEKRTKQQAVPDNYNEILSGEQMATITKLESFGWELFFIRRATTQPIIPIMRCPISSECYTAFIDRDGTIKRDHPFTLRSEDRHLH